MFSLRAPTALDAGLTKACGTDPNGVCRWVYDATGSEGLARFVDWLLGTPLTVLGIILGAWFLSWLARRFLGRLIRRTMIPPASVTSGLAKVGVRSQGEGDPRREARVHSISEVVGSTAAVIIWAIALITVLGEFGIDLGPLIAAAGIAGIALGFGAQSMVKDFLAGLFVLIEDQYGIGDVVDLGEASGTVEQISLRATVLRSLDGTVWHVPNGEVIRVGNKSQLWSVAIVDVTVSYDSDLEHVQSVILQTAIDVCASETWRDEVIDEPEVLGIEGLGTVGVSIRTVVKTRPGTQFGLQRSLREAVKAALDEAGIVIPVQRLQ